MHRHYRAAYPHDIDGSNLIPGAAGQYAARHLNFAAAVTIGGRWPPKRSTDQGRPKLFGKEHH